MREFFREIKYAYERVVKGWDSRIMWEFDTYFSQFIPPLKEFCQNQLKDKELMKINPKRKEVFTETLKRIKAYEKMDCVSGYAKVNEETLLWEYFGANIGTYWN